jgi:hypothetical protein
MAESTGAVTAAVSIGLVCTGSSILGAVSDTGATSLSLAGTTGATSPADFSAVGLVASFLAPKRLPKIDPRLPPFFSWFSALLVVGDCSVLLSSAFFS